MSPSPFLSFGAHCGHKESHLFDQGPSIFGVPVINKSSKFDGGFSKPFLGTQSHTLFVLPMIM